MKITRALLYVLLSLTLCLGCLANNSVPTRLLANDVSNQNPSPTQDDPAVTQEPEANTPETSSTTSLQSGGAVSNATPAAGEVKATGNNQSAVNATKENPVNTDDIYPKDSTIEEIPPNDSKSARERAIQAMKNANDKVLEAEGECEAAKKSVEDAKEHASEALKVLQALGVQTELLTNALQKASNAEKEANKALSECKEAESAVDKAEEATRKAACDAIGLSRAAKASVSVSASASGKSGALPTMENAANQVLKAEREARRAENQAKKAAAAAKKAHEAAILASNARDSAHEVAAMVTSLIQRHNEEANEQMRRKEAEARAEYERKIEEVKKLAEKEAAAKYTKKMSNEPPAKREIPPKKNEPKTDASSIHVSIRVQLLLLLAGFIYLNSY